MLHKQAEIEKKKRDLRTGGVGGGGRSEAVSVYATNRVGLLAHEWGVPRARRVLVE